MAKHQLKLYTLYYQEGEIEIVPVIVKGLLRKEVDWIFD